MINREMQSQLESDSQSLAYIYFEYQDRHFHTSENILRTILRQLIKPMEIVPMEIWYLYETCVRQEGFADYPELIRILKIVTDMVAGRTLICLDGLDQARNSSVLTVVDDLISLRNTNVFVTSRPLSFQGSREICKYEANIVDIELFVRRKLDQSRRFQSHQDLQEAITRELCSSAHGM